MTAAGRGDLVPRALGWSHMNLSSARSLWICASVTCREGQPLFALLTATVALMTSQEHNMNGAWQAVRKY